MSWFWFSLMTLLCWSGSDLFSKIGCRDQLDKTAHLKMVTAVGAVMGIHAAVEIFCLHVSIDLQTIIYYLPVSLLYILSMALGYLGLRYIELSVSSPICNSSGALVSIVTLIISGFHGLSPWQLIATILVCFGVIGLGFVELHEDEQARAVRQNISHYKYAKSFTAIALPVLYCILDAAGTLADSLVLKTLDEDSANVAYELTFLAAGLFSLTLLFLRHEKFVLHQEVPKYIGACFETAGQFTYIYALSDTFHVALSAPLISSYCLFSVLWGRLFLKEKLSWKHYAMIFIAVAGIVLLGSFD